MLPTIKNIIRFVLYKIKWKNKTRIHYSAKVSFNSTFEGWSQIFENTDFSGHLGFGSYIANNCSLKAYIGRYTSIAPFVRCNPGRHPITEPYVSTSPCFYSLNIDKQQCGYTYAKKQCFEETKCYNKNNNFDIKIGNDCWIGESVFIVGGITIGDGAIVLAHAVVTNNIPPYAIVGGCPAKIIKYRYDIETIKQLLDYKWWEIEPKWFMDNWEIMNNIDVFKKHMSQNKQSNARISQSK